MKKLVLFICVLGLFFSPSVVLAGETTDADREFQAAEAQKERDFRASESQKQREWDKEQKLLEREYTERKSCLSSITKVVANRAVVELRGYISSVDVKNLIMDKESLLRWYPEVKTIEIHVNSGGGSATDGLAMGDAIERLAEDFNVTTIGYGMIASAAVMPFVAGKKRVCMPSTLFMMHEASIFKFFGSDTKTDLKTQHDMLTKIEDAYNGFIASKCKLTVDEIKEMSEKVTYFTAQQAKEWGMVDEII